MDFTKLEEAYQHRLLSEIREKLGSLLEKHSIQVANLMKQYPVNISSNDGAAVQIFVNEDRNTIHVGVKTECLTSIEKEKISQDLADKIIEQGR